MTVSLSAAIPTSPLVDDNGNIRPEWRAFFTRLWQRTGGAIGQSIDTEHLQQQIDTEAATRSAADAALTAAIDNEAQTRATADDVLTTALNTEAYLRQQADAQTVAQLNNYVLITQLCSQWAACNLAFLPTADPGGGKPWLDGPHIAVGAVTTTGIELEDASGDWELQDGTGHWMYG